MHKCVDLVEVNKCTFYLGRILHYDDGIYDDKTELLVGMLAAKQLYEKLRNECKETYGDELFGGDIND